LAARTRGRNFGGSEARPVASNRGADGDAGRWIAAADCETSLPSRHELADVGDDAGEHGCTLSFRATLRNDPPPHRPPRNGVPGRGAQTVRPTIACAPLRIGLGCLYAQYD